jgi:hypothetical protein
MKKKLRTIKFILQRMSYKKLREKRTNKYEFIENNSILMSFRFSLESI